MADANGNIHVKFGDRIPGIPQHQFKAGAEYLVTPEWKVGADMVAVGQQFFVGDDANQNPKLPAYVVVNLHTSYQWSKNVTLFAVVNNLFNNKYALFGTYFHRRERRSRLADRPDRSAHRSSGPALLDLRGIRVKL